MLRRGQVPPHPLPPLPSTRKQPSEPHITPLLYSTDPHSSDSDFGSQRKLQNSSDSDFPDTKIKIEGFQKPRSGIKTQISGEITSTPITRNLKIPRTVPIPDFNYTSKNRTPTRPAGPSQSRLKQIKEKKNPNRPANSINVLDRLSVRTELSNNRPLNLSSEDGIMASGKGLYYFPADEESELSPANEFTENLDVNKKISDSSNPTIQDQIIATQLRLLNRELTPTISDVYHERNIGLGLAPPLSKLLISNQATTSAFRNEKETEIVQNLGKIIIDETKRDHTETASKNSWGLSKSNLNLHTNNDSIVSVLLTNEEGKRHGSPCSELSRRDEGDGRSIADSQCSVSSFKKPPSVRNEKSEISDSLYYEPSENGQNCIRENGDANPPPMPRTRTTKGPPPPVPTNRNKITQN